MVVMIVILAMLVLALAAALIVTGLNDRDDRLRVARRNACAYNEARNLIVMTLAGRIQDAADRLPALEETLAPDVRDIRAHALFRAVVDGYKPPTITIDYDGTEE